MNLYLLAMSMTVMGNLMYHFCQKLVRSDVNPFVSLTATYAVALVLSVLLAPFFMNDATWFKSFHMLNWASFLTGVAIIFVELGFLLAYRAGWVIGTAALYSHVVLALLLIPIGAIIFKNHLTKLNLLGVLLAMVGILLMNRK